MEMNHEIAKRAMGIYESLLDEHMADSEKEALWKTSVHRARKEFSAASELPKGLVVLATNSESINADWEQVYFLEFRDGKFICADVKSPSGDVYLGEKSYKYMMLSFSEWTYMPSIGAISLPDWVKVEVMPCSDKKFGEVEKFTVDLLKKIPDGKYSGVIRIIQQEIPIS